jgi:hypothetical protein
MLLVPFCSKSHVASVTTIVLLLDWFMGERQTLLPLKVDINTNQSKNSAPHLKTPDETCNVFTTFDLRDPGSSYSKLKNCTPNII